MEKTELQVPKSTAEADTFEAHKEIRKAAAAGKPLMEGVPPPVENEPSSASEGKPKPKEQTAEAPESSQPQEKREEKKHPNRKPEAERRIEDLLRENTRIKQELEESRKKSVPQVSPPAPEPPKPAAEPAKLPTMAEYAREQFKRRPNALQEELIEEWIDLRDRERERTRQAAAEQEKRQTEARTLGERRTAAIEKLRADRPDVDPEEHIFGRADGGGVMLGGVKDPQGRITTVIGELEKNVANWVDVLVYLHDHPDELLGIQRMTAAEQYDECRLIGRLLTKNPAKPSQATPPEPRKPAAPVPISRIPAPSRPIGGSEPAAVKSTSEARSMEEHRALRRAQRAG
jgi:hypothetical protein